MKILRSFQRFFPRSLQAKDSPSDISQESFQEVLRAWGPKAGKKAIILRWFMTDWCNYRCPYCPQTHTRGRILSKRQGKEFLAHAFDNFPRDEWIRSIKLLGEKFRLTLTITGGEPFLDRENFPLFLREIVGLASVENVRIDTNASWNPSPYEGIDQKKIFLMCTYHPSQIREEEYFLKIKNLLSRGFQISMVNYVMAPAQRESFQRLRDKFRSLHIPLNPNPLWGPGRNRPAGEIAFLKEVMNEFDLFYRAELVSPKGKLCLYPTLAYEMDQTGQIITGCHPDCHGDFIAGDLPEFFDKPVLCPQETCVCLDKYSFLEGCGRNISLNPLCEFAKYIDPVKPPARSEKRPG